MTFNRKSKHTGRNIAVGSAVAGLIGYAAGVLTAPKSGKQTRDDIAKKAGDVKDSIEDQLNQLNEELKDLLKKTKVKTVSLNSSARAEFNEAVVKAKDAQNKSMEVLKAAKAGEASDPDLNKAVKQARLAIKNLSKFLKN
ncbi:YtxH domain-containing protein [Candidatus Saccharibacteria bacterium]|nr:YtxH domain-containing protein [Candidatus Saccharibacteria bacterium]